MPISQAERLCPNAMFVRCRGANAWSRQQEIRDVLEEWSPIVEPASIDEFYLSLAGTEALYRHEPLGGDGGPYSAGHSHPHRA
jgi:DNA polymerase-4